jgi:pimeloyl-ACP methyl ester carboxylesterase
MVTTTCGRLSICGHRRKSQHGSYGLDTTVALEINGTKQRVRLCAARSGLPPVLIVQAGPGFPVVNEVAKFQQCLQLEENFSVAYWDQRGCGHAALQDAQNVSLDTQVDDLCAVVRWLAEETGQQVVVLGISLGATMALLAADREPGGIKALVAVSIDADTSASDASAFSFLQEVSTQADRQRMTRLIKKLGAPPYTTPAPFQLRARLLTDLGCIEHGKRFGELLRSLLYSLIRTYGWFGTAAALRNMNAIQRGVLPELARLNLFANWPRPAMPVHYLFGGSDPLVPHSLVQKVSSVIAREDTVAVVPNSGHMVHFDEPAIVRSLITQAHFAS